MIIGKQSENRKRAWNEEIETQKVNYLIITVLWNERWMKWRMRMESIGGLDEVELLKRKGGEEVKDEGGGCS